MTALEQWRRSGREVEVFGHRIFCVEAGPVDGPRILLLHGFPSSSYDFHAVLERLARSYRVIVHDHLGFGLSSKPRRYSYSLMEQTDLALGLWRQLGIRSGHVVAHDYGTSIATELVARRERGLLPLELESLTFSNGSVFLELARLRPSQRLLKSSLLGALFARAIGKSSFRRIIRRLWGDSSRLRAAELDTMWNGIESGGGRRVMPRIARYLDDRARFADRWSLASSRLDVRTLVLWGDRDPVAVMAIAHRIVSRVPHSKLVVLEGVGHYPMLEAPDEWSSALLSFLDES